MQFLGKTILASVMLLTLTATTAMSQTNPSDSDVKPLTPEEVEALDEVNRKMRLKRAKKLNQLSILPENKEIGENMTAEEKAKLLEKSIKETETMVKGPTGKMMMQEQICPYGTTVQTDGTCLITGDYRY